MKTKQQILKELKIETKRLLNRIEEAEANLGEKYPSTKHWPAVKRASLDLNRVGAELRKGPFL